MYTSRETLQEAYRQGIDGMTFAAVEAGGTEEFLDQLRQELVILVDSQPRQQWRRQAVEKRASVHV